MTPLPKALETALAGRYVVERELGRGGMATVYLAHDLRHDRHIALKVLHPELAHAVGPGRFLREIRTTARLQHPHILPVFDSGEADRQLWYAMPYVEGESLRAHLGPQPKLPIEEAVRIASEVADALAYAHERGIIHRQVYTEQAVALDSTFALAYRRLGNAIGWQTGTGDGMANTYKERAGALDHGLSPRDSLLVLADSLFQDPYSISAAGYVASPAWGARLFTILEEAVRRYPEDPEAWDGLGEARYHLGVWLVPTAGWRATLAAFERSVALDSLLTSTYVHLIETSFAVGDTARARGVVAALIRLDPQSGVVRGLPELQRLLALPDSSDQARLLDSLRQKYSASWYQRSSAGRIRPSSLCGSRGSGSASRRSQRCAAPARPPARFSGAPAGGARTRRRSARQRIE